MIGDFLKPGLLDGLLAISVDQTATVHATAALLDGLAWFPLLRHFTVLSLALLDDVHADLHAETLLRLSELHLVWWLD